MTPKLMFLLALALCGTSRFTSAEDFPQRFEAGTPRNQVVVVLDKDGRASYSDRTVRPDGVTSTFDSPVATWGWREGNVLGAGSASVTVPPRRALWLVAKGVVDGAVREFRIDYYYRPDVLEEFDKTGIVKTLKRVRDGSAAAAPSKPKGNPPR